MAFSTVTFYGRRGQTAVISPAGDVSECDDFDSEEEEYVPVSNNVSHLASDSSSDEDDQFSDGETHQQQPTSSTSIPRKKGKQSEIKYKWLKGDPSSKTKAGWIFSSPFQIMYRLQLIILINCLMTT